MSRAADIRLNLLLFSVGGVHFGMDADLAAGMAAYNGEEAEDLFWFHKELEYCRDAFVYTAPFVVAVRTADSTSYRVIIDAMEDVVEISMMHISPFPPLLEPLALRKGLWGILPRNGHMVLLVDLQRLAQGKCPA
ncbi:MAG: hypothetical protein M0T70_13330 [Geobacteraceae bacterium]|nr:hypothetical protein [Geobacteraceae bacterium]